MLRTTDRGRRLAEEVAILDSACDADRGGARRRPDPAGSAARAAVSSGEPGHESSRAAWHRRWPWFGLALVLAGCFYQYRVASHAEGVALDRSELDPELVKVVTAKDVDRPYRKIGIVHAPASLPEREAIAALQRRARSLGGDALLDLRRQAAGATADRASSSPGLAAALWEADVIVWTDKQVDGASPPPPGAKPPGAKPPGGLVPVLPKP
jgi:hypothetical protein